MQSLRVSMERMLEEGKLPTLSFKSSSPPPHNTVLSFLIEYKGPPSGTSSAKQSPALQHRVLGQRSAGLQDEQ